MHGEDGGSGVGEMREVVIGVIIVNEFCHATSGSEAIHWSSDELFDKFMCMKLHFQSSLT